MKIAVVGLGKIGLPLAVQYARMGHEVQGVDINEKSVAAINRGCPPFPGEDNLQEYLEQVVEEGLLKATTSFQEAIESASTIVVAVPLIIDENANPDFSALDEVTENIARYLLTGALICYETTLPIGTTRNRLTPILERVSKRTVSLDFHVVFSPERVLTGRVFQDLRKYPKIVGGIGQSCTARGVAFYESVLEFDERNELQKPNGVWAVRNTETAEFIKLAETTYRDVNIGLANQFAKHADEIGVDIFEIISAANSQPFSLIHQPGISVGGHCIPVYPYFYLKSDPMASIVRAARKVNENQPQYAVRVLKEKANGLEQKKVLILGVSYRPGVKEIAFSGAFNLRDSLILEGAIPYFIDPLYNSTELSQHGLNPWEKDISKIELVIVHTAFEQVQEFIDTKLPHCKIVIDGRNCLSGASNTYRVYALGRLS
jgi:nucleotide sugar dehydrogenase